MFLVSKSAVLAATLSAVWAVDIGVPGPWAATDPLINIYNTGTTDVCYKVEYTSGNFPTSTICDSSPGFVVQAGQSVSLHTGAGFNGAITAITKGIKGARHELNFAASPGSAWYDVDYQLGMSDSTLGPADHRPRIVSGKASPSVSGEQDTLAKANSAWPTTTNQASLLQNPDYLKPGSNGQLSFVYMDMDAPEDVAEFFQLTAEFTAYIGTGSVAGVAVAPNTVQSEMTGAADQKSWIVDTQQMEIIAY